MTAPNIDTPFLRHGVRAVGIAGILVNSLPAQSGSVQAVVVRDRCVECGFSVTKVTTIDGAIEPKFAGGTNAAVARDRAGRIFFSRATGDIPTVFDATGRYLRVLTTKGRGPGELMTIAWIDAGRDDSVRVYSFDRVTTYGPDLAYVRSFVPENPLLANFASLGVLSDGKVVATTTSPVRDATGKFTVPVYLRSATGRALRELLLAHQANGDISFGVGAARDSARFWGFEPSPDGDRGYMLTLLDQRGGPHFQIVREPSWWLARPQNEKGAVQSFVKAVAEDERGRIVVVIAQPKPMWRQIKLGPGGASSPRYDAIIEVIDPKSGALVGQRRIVGYPCGLFDDRYVATYREVNDFPVLDVWRIEF